MNAIRDVSRRAIERFGLALLLMIGLPKACMATDWMMFAFDMDQHANNVYETAINAANVSALVPVYSKHPPKTTTGPVFLSNVVTQAGTLDLLFVTTVDGTLLAINAGTGDTVWSQPTIQQDFRVDAAPVVDPNRRFIYGYGADDRIHKYDVANGTEILDTVWPAISSLKAEHAGGALEIATASSGHSYLYAVTTGYYGDGGDYQGHVTAIDLATGAWNVFNAACSNVTVHMISNGTVGVDDCATTRNGIWGRSGAVYDRRTDKLYVTTGNGPYTFVGAGFDWGDSILALHPDGSGAGGGIPVDSYTPINYADLEFHDSDLGSASIVLLPTPSNSRIPHLGAVMGKDSQVRLLDLDDLSGQGNAGGVGGEVQLMDALGLDTDIPTGHPAVWVDSHGDGSTWLFVPTPSSFVALQLTVDAAGNPSLAVRWRTSGFSGASPVIANDVVYYGACGCAMDPRTGKVLWSYPMDVGCCFGYWPFLIVVNGRLYVTGSSLMMFELRDGIFKDGFETPSTQNGRTATSSLTPL